MNTYALRKLSSLLLRLEVIRYEEAQKLWNISMIHILKNRLEKVYALKELQGYEQKIKDCKTNKRR